MLRNKKYTPYLFIAPAVILFAVFKVYPIIDSFFLSFCETLGGSQTFNGINNYLRLLNDQTFWKAMTNTLIFLVIQVPLMLAMGWCWPHY